MARRTTAAHQEDMMRIVDAWKAQGGTWPAAAAEIADFAIREKLYNASSGLKRLCAQDIAKAMREEYITDQRGRPVRKLHAARFAKEDGSGGVKQKTLWADIDTAERDFMEVAFQQRREQIVGDCCQLTNDIEYFNGRHPNEKPIQLIFDFRDDIEERSMPEEYCPPSQD